MILYELHGAQDLSATTQKLFNFKQLFDYPFDEIQRFRIDHSPDYSAFYRSIGESTTLIAEANNQIIAAISIAIRTIRIHNSEQSYIYIGDLKIHPNFRSSSVLFRLAKYLQQKITQYSNSPAYGIVMDGTSVTPQQYSGRLGIPLFQAQKKVCILRFSTEISLSNTQSAENLCPKLGYELYRALNTKGTLLTLSNSSIRSTLEPRWFHSEFKACGLLEDTRKAKKLLLSHGEEIISAHLSYFSFQDTNSAVEVLNKALFYARHQGYPAMFVALSSTQLILLQEALKFFSYQNLSATLYATHPICEHITVNTADI